MCADTAEVSNYKDKIRGYWTKIDFCLEEVDECGVCGGLGRDLTTGCCPNTGKGPDGEIQDCDNTCTVTSQTPFGGTNFDCAGCDGVPNSELVDNCGVCGGDNDTF